MSQSNRDFLEASLADAEARHGNGHPSILGPLNAAAEIHLFNRNFERAEELFKRAIEITVQENPGQPERLKLAKQKLAWLNLLQEKHEEAESYFMQAIDVMTQQDSTSEESIAQAMRSLVYAYLKCNKLKEAESTLHNLLNVYQSKIKDSSYQSAFVYMALAVISEARLDGESARQHMEKAGGLIKDKCAIGYTVDFLSLSEIINLYFSQDRKSEALELVACTMLESEDAYWPHNPRAGDALAALAEYMRGQRKYKQAESIHKRAIAIREYTCGPFDLELASLSLNLGNMYLGLRKYADAEPLVKNAMKARVKHYGSEHPAVAACVETYATILRKTKRAALSGKLDMRAREIRSACVAGFEKTKS